MRLRLVVVLCSMALLAAFVAFNWAVFAAPAVMSLGMVSFEAPLGLAMLGLTVAIFLIFVVYMAIWQGRVLMEERQQTKELQLQRTLADQAEASRFVELRGAMHAELQQLSEQLRQSQSELKNDMRESVNSLAAMLGEIDDRIKSR